MIAFAVATFHAPRLLVGTELVEAVVWVKPAGLPGGASATLRIWTPAGARVRELRELAEGSSDLLQSATAVDERTADYVAGRWSDDVREFALAIAVPPCADGDELLAARVTVLADDSVAGRATVAVGFGGVPAPSAAVSATAPPVDVAELPTGKSPWPRHTEPSAYPGQDCPDCGEQTFADDRFCEGCGRALTSDPH